MGIVNNLLRRERRAEEGPEFQAAPAVHQSQPPLMLLLPDAAGVATYALNVFPHAKAAEYYYLSQLTARNVWRNICRAIGQAVPMYQKRMAAVAAWNNGAVALKEALVAEAKMRIPLAGLDKEMMGEVDKTVKQAQKAMKLAEKDAARAAAEEEAEPAVAAALQEEVAAKAVFGDVETHSEDTNGHEKEPPGGLFTFFRATESRWEPSEEPFRGFNSPRGRFHHRNRDDERTA